MSELSVDHGDQRVALLGLYDTALPEVYGYLASRCGSASVAEDLTSETFLAAVDAVKRHDACRELTVAWLIGVARNKLVDHWRRRERESKVLQAVGDDPDGRCRGAVGRAARRADRARDPGLARPHHRSALTLRYLDGLPVREVATCIWDGPRAPPRCCSCGPGRVPRDLRVRARRSRGGLTDDRSLRRPAHPASSRIAPARASSGSCAPCWSPSSVSTPMTSRSSTCPRGRPCPLLPSPPRPPPPLPQPSSRRRGGADPLPRRLRRRSPRSPGTPRRSEPSSSSAVVGDDGRVGHAELLIGPARFMLADEYPEIGVLSPATLGGTPLALHLSVDDVDRLFERAVDAGAESLVAPDDQPHGARHGTLLDPYGHRWMLSQQLEDIDLDTYRRAVRGHRLRGPRRRAGRAGRRGRPARHRRRHLGRRLLRRRAGRPSASSSTCSDSRSSSWSPATTAAPSCTASCAGPRAASCR